MEAWHLLGFFLLKKISIFAHSFSINNWMKKKQQLVYLFCEKCIIALIVE